MDDDVVYEDFTFQEPFKGREGVRELLGDAMSLPKAGVEQRFGSVEIAFSIVFYYRLMFWPYYLTRDGDDCV